MKITKREKQLLNAIAKSVDVKGAANALGLAPSTAYNMLSRLRKKYREARKVVNTCLAYRRKSPLLDNVLARKLSYLEEVE